MKKNHIEDGRILPVLNEIAKKTGATPIEMTTKQNHIGDSRILPVLESIRDSIDAGGGSGAGVMSSAVSELVGEIIITDENQPIIFDNLDAIRDGGYTLTIDSGIASVNSSMQLMFNGDSIFTDYNRTYIAGVGRSGTTFVDNVDDASIIYLPAGTKGYGVFDISATGLFSGILNRTDKDVITTSGRKKTEINNVTRVEIITSLGEVPIGSRIALYKRKVEIKGNLVKEVILDMDSTSVVFDNLDAVADGGYVLNFETGALGEPTAYELFYNDDRTPTNYKRVYFGTWRGADFARGETDLSVFSDANVGCRAFGKVDISSSGISLADSVSNDETYLTYNIYPKTLLTNVTKIEVNTSDAQAGTVIPAGTKISLYRKKHFVGNSGTYDSTKDNEQDTRLDVIEAEQITQNTRLTGVESENIEQDATLVSLQEQIDELKLRPVDSMGSMSVNQLVSEIVITDESQPIVFENLDAIADGGYIMVMDMKHSSVQVNYALYFNDDTTNENYQKAWFGIDGDGSEGRGRVDGSMVAQVANTSMFGEIKISPTGKYIANYLFSLGAGYQSNISLKTPIDNVTKLELVAPEPTPIGSRISLYKRKTEIKPNLVKEVILDADSTSIVFDNLDAVADGGYELILDCEISKVACTISAYLNDDDTESNYSRVGYGVAQGGTLSSLVSSGSILTTTTPNDILFTVFNISQKGFVKTTLQRQDETLYEYGVYKDTPITNVTKIELRASVENAIPKGTKASLYRRKHDIGSNRSAGGTYDPTKDNEQDARLTNIEAEQITQNNNINELQTRLSTFEEVVLKQTFTLDQSYPLDLTPYDKIVVESITGVAMGESDIRDDLSVVFGCMWTAGGETLENPIKFRYVMCEYDGIAKTIMFTFIKDIEYRNGQAPITILNPVSTIDLMIVGKNRHTDNK